MTVSNARGSIGAILTVFHAFGGYKGTYTIINFNNIQLEGACWRIVASCSKTFKLPNFLKIEIIGFCLTASLHKSNFHTNHAHHAHHAQTWSVEPLSDSRLDPPLTIKQMNQICTLFCKYSMYFSILTSALS